MHLQQMKNAARKVIVTEANAKQWVVLPPRKAEALVRKWIDLEMDFEVPGPELGAVVDCLEFFLADLDSKKRLISPNGDAHWTVKTIGEWEEICVSAFYRQKRSEDDSYYAGGCGPDYLVDAVRTRQAMYQEFLAKKK